MPGRSDVVGGRWLGGYRYKPLDPDFDFGTVPKHRDMRFEEFVVVDIGAGLGRALFLRTKLPFKESSASSTPRSLSRPAIEHAPSNGVFARYATR
jgi:hypothetical protein